MNLPAGLPITPEDWDKTPLSVQALVSMLWEENHILKEQVNRLQTQVVELQSDIKMLKERLNKNSQNSSKPPSSDPPQTPKYPKADVAGEKMGEKKGHHGHGRKLKPPDQVNRIVKSVLSLCKDCGAMLKGEDKCPERHQVSVFRIFDNRSGNGAKTLLGENYADFDGGHDFATTETKCVGLPDNCL